MIKCCNPAVNALVILLTLCDLAVAQDEKAELVRRIVVAQGLHQMFDQQITQQREATKEYAVRLFQDTIRQAGGEPNHKERAAFEKLVQRSATLFTSEEFVRAWAAEYGKELTLQDLAAILRYYESPIGRKDAAASRAALTRFSLWVAEQGQKRASPLIADFAAELKAARR